MHIYERILFQWKGNMTNNINNSITQFNDKFQNRAFLKSKHSMTFKMKLFRTYNIITRHAFYDIIETFVQFHFQ